MILVSCAESDQHGFLFAALNLALLLLLAVEFVTAALTDGIGLNMLRSVTLGVKGYFQIVASIAGYLATLMQAIRSTRAHPLFSGAK